MRPSSPKRPIDLQMFGENQLCTPSSECVVSVSNYLFQHALGTYGKNSKLFSKGIKGWIPLKLGLSFFLTVKKSNVSNFGIISKCHCKYKIHVPISINKKPTKKKFVSIKKKRPTIISMHLFSALPVVVTTLATRSNSVLPDKNAVEMGGKKLANLRIKQKTKGIKRERWLRVLFFGGEFLGDFLGVKQTLGFRFVENL